MKFRDIKGNETVIGVLRSLVDSGRVPHAMMFHENPASGGLALSSAFLQYLNCENRKDGDSCGECPSCRQMEKLVHPDIHYVFPVNTGDAIKNSQPVSEMGIAQFRELFLKNPYFTEQELYDALGIEGKAGNIAVQEAHKILNTLSLTSVQDGYKAVLMFLPEKMNVQAANKLLKSLEEPPQKTIFILVTQSPEDLMPTIVSRCQLLRIMPVDGDPLALMASDEISHLWDSLVDALKRRDLLSALDVAEALSGLGSREKQKSFCIFASEKIRRIFLTGQALASFEPEAAAVFSSKFCYGAAANLDKAALLIGRNVSAKMVFTDLVNRLFVSL